MEQQLPQVRVEIRVENDIITARQAGRNMAEKLGFGTGDQTRLATAISELARNVIRYAQRGVCTVTDASDEQMLRVKITVEDEGPGIADIQKALSDGFSTGRSLGMGLPGTKRLVQDFDINSKPGGTNVSIAIAQPRQTSAASRTRTLGARSAPAATTRPGVSPRPIRTARPGSLNRPAAGGDSDSTPSRPSSGLRSPGFRRK